LHIQLYPKLHPKRFGQAVKDMSQVSDLLQTTGEPLIVEAMTKQVLEKPLHIRRDVTFIGSYVGQFHLHGDSDVKFLDANVVQPIKTRYTIILSEDFFGDLTIERSNIKVEPKSKDVALAGIGNTCENLTINNSEIDGAIFYVKQLNLQGDVTISSRDQGDIGCHILDTSSCDLTLVRNSVRHDVDMVDFNSITISGKCVLSGGFKIQELNINDTFNSLELLTFTSHFNDPSIIRLGSINYLKGNKNVTHIYLDKTLSRFLANIDDNLNIRVNDSKIQMEDIIDGAKWSIGKDVVVQVSDGARSGLRDLGQTTLVSSKNFKMRNKNSATSMESVFDDPSLTGLGEPDKTDKKATEKIKEMIGQPFVKKQLEDFIAQSEMDKIRVARGLSDGSTITRNMVFSGPPGVGKTEFARLVGQALYENGVLPENKLVEASAARDLIAGFLGQTADKTHEVAASAYGGVLFIDEAYALANDKDGQFGDKAMEQLLKEADDHRDELVIILAGYEEDMREMFETGNSGLKRRFPYWISFTNYNHDEFVEIFKLMLKGMKSIMDDSLIASKPFNELLTSYADPHSNAGGVRNLVEALVLARDSRLRTLGANVTNDDLVRITDKDLVTVYKRRVADLKKEKEYSREKEEFEE
jgi:hypothetical protein